MMRHLLALGVLVATLTAASAADKPLSVLFLHGRVTTKAPGQDSIFSKRSYLPDEALQKRLAAEGMVWGAEEFSTQMTAEYLRQFNVIVMLDFPIIEKHPAEEKEVRAQEQLLARYVADGGGLMLTGNTEYGMWALERDFEEMNRFLQPYGAQVLHEQVGENDKALTIPAMGISALGYTSNVVKHPVTEGVRGLLYPTDHAWSFWTHPLQLGEGWQALVKGSPSAYSFSTALGLGGPTSQIEKKPGTYKSEPPLVAIKDIEKGRMCLWPTVPSAFIIDGYHDFWGGGIIMEGTRQDKASDGAGLVVNLLRWLGKPSQETFGGYKTPSEQGQEPEPGFVEVNWDKVKLEGRPQPDCYRGLIGLHSNLSDGAGTPEEMMAAAKAAGYHFAAFTDALGKLDADELERLKAACLKASDASFQAFPGFTYEDESGNGWMVFGRQVHWPKDEWWSKTRPGALRVNNIIFRGFQFLPLIMLPGEAEPPWLQGNFKGIAVQQYAGAKLVRDSEDVYRKLQRNGFDLFPVVANVVKSPAEVQAAATAPMQTYVRWWELEDVISAISGNIPMYKGGYVFHRTGFVSGGPIIEDFRVFNFGTADLAIPQNDRYRLHLDVSAERGLKEIALYDGAELRRRMLLKGEKNWVGDFEGYQDRNRHYLAVITDTTGGRAISGVRDTSNQEVGMIRCTDNLNTYTSGKFKAVNYHAVRGLENYIEQNAGSFTAFPFLGVPDTERPAVDQQLTITGRFGYVKDDVIEHHYAPGASANWNLTDAPERAEPQTVAKGRVRTTMFTPRAEGTAVYLVEGDFDMLSDLDLPRGNVPCYRTPWLLDADTMYVSRTEGKSECYKLESRLKSRSAALDGLEYVAQIAPLGGSRAIVPLQPGMGYDAIWNGERYYLSANVSVPEKKLAKGQPLRYRYLAVWDTVGGKPDVSFIEDVYARLGLRGKPAYQVAPEHGKVLDTRFTLRLQADGGGFAGTITKAALPMDLPVMIEGLNDRWPAGLLYRGKSDLLIPVWKFSKVANRYAVREKRTLENELRRFPVLDGRGMLQVDTELGDRKVYIGNLLVCDQPEVFLELEDARPGKQVVMVNNPTDKDLTVTVRPGPGFDLLGAWEKKLEVKAGEVVRFGL
ncbi:MAG: hypothetical protein ABFD94_22425 [Armatimonadia bacterium]